VTKVVIFGAGDIARLAHYYFSHDSLHETVGFAVVPALARARRSRRPTRETGPPV
jgi:hypothetical protein